MNTIRSQIIALLLLISGIVLLGGGVWGFYSLYAISHRYEHTTGIIRTLQTKKIYRYRKIRYKKEMQICYQNQLLAIEECRRQGICLVSSSSSA